MAWFVDTAETEEDGLTDADGQDIERSYFRKSASLLLLPFTARSVAPLECKSKPPLRSNPRLALLSLSPVLALGIRLGIIGQNMTEMGKGEKEKLSLGAVKWASQLHREIHIHTMLRLH